MDRSTDIFGEQNYTPVRWIAIIGKEFGEACKAEVNASQARSCVDYDECLANYRAELIQLANVTIKAIMSFDRN